MRVRFVLVFVPVTCLLLFTFAVSPNNPNRGGSYIEAWPNIAAIWMFLAFILVASWALRIRASDMETESRVPGLVVLAWSAFGIVIGAAGLLLASAVSGFPSEYQHLMLWFSLTTGLFLLGLGLLFREPISKGFLGSLGYGLSVMLGIVSVCFVAGVSTMLLLFPSTGVT